MLAIDPGYRNFAFCSIDNFNYLNPHKWQHEDLWKGRKGTPSRTELMEMMNDWCSRNQEELAKADVIVVERQMRKPFIAMECFIVGRYYHKTKVVHAATVGKFWGLPGTREQKKAVGISRCMEAGLEFPDVDKQDDLADAWLMAMRYICLYGGVDKKTL